jgi:hypothetical protein
MCRFPIIHSGSRSDYKSVQCLLTLRAPKNMRMLTVSSMAPVTPLAITTVGINSTCITCNVPRDKLLLSWSVVMLIGRCNYLVISVDMNAGKK